MAARTPERRLFDRLWAWRGALGWWPAESCLEMMVGAVLTQNTSWTNVVPAIAELKCRGILSLPALHRAVDADVAHAIRSAGCARVKTRRLRNLVVWLVAQGGVAAIAEFPTARLREGLLSVSGVGPETADAILLYGFHRPVFVVDAYARRLFTRLGWADVGGPYEILRARMERALPAEPQILGHYHALIVEHGKAHCRARPRCGGCPLQAQCPEGLGNGARRD